MQVPCDILYHTGLQYPLSDQHPPSGDVHVSSGGHHITSPCRQVMSTSGVVAIRFIIQHTQYARLVPLVTGRLSSRSREIRRACCEFLEHMIAGWPTHVLERHVAAVQEALRRGVADADSEVRATSRRWVLCGRPAAQLHWSAGSLWN